MSICLNLDMMDIISSCEMWGYLRCSLIASMVVVAPVRADRLGALDTLHPSHVT